jgi:ketosteroid isomerase-like protein
MSGNVDLVGAAFDAWNRQDLDGLLASLAPDVELWTSGVFPDFDAVYRGHVGFAEFWRKLHEPWDTLRADPEAIEELCDWAVYVVRFRAKGAGSGVDVDQRFANAALILNDRVVRIVARRTLEEAREVALEGQLTGPV